MKGTIDVTAARVVATQTLLLYSKTIGEMSLYFFLCVFKWCKIGGKIRH